MTRASAYLFDGERDVMGNLTIHISGNSLAQETGLPQEGERYILKSKQIQILDTFSLQIQSSISKLGNTEEILYTLRMHLFGLQFFLPFSTGFAYLENALIYVTFLPILLPTIFFFSLSHLLSLLSF